MSLALARKKPVEWMYLLHLRDIRLRQGLQGGEAGIEGRCHLVHPLIGALGGQTDRRTAAHSPCR